MSRKYKWEIKKVEQALIDKKGYVSRAAKKLGLHVSTLYNYISENPHLKDIILDVREAALDNAEIVLRKAVNDNNLKAAMFELERRGADRGYSNRVDFTGRITHDVNAVSINIDAVPVTQEMLDLSNELLKKFTIENKK